MFNKYRKFVTALVTPALGWSAVVIASDVAEITATEWQLGALALATSLGVYVVPNES